MDEVYFPQIGGWITLLDGTFVIEEKLDVTWITDKRG